MSDAPQLIFDAHLDMAWNALEWNRDLLKPVSELREFESQFEGIIPGECTVSWEELRRGRIGMTISTLLPRLHRKDSVLYHFQSRDAAYGAPTANWPTTARWSNAAFCARSLIRRHFGVNHRLWGKRHDRRTADRVHPEHGRQSPDSFACPDPRMV
ncbi:MAG: hypothetical protein Ct9H300mP1_33600 [Planctomycetaceae bacterium]|nr:MAG: hypothetical protein Ct9H300mP1_33600 [Planctomycetaceae bacterium]